jgi:hypothetical protein
MGGDADTPEEIDGHELADFAEDHAAFAFISLFHGPKRDLRPLLVIGVPVENCAYHVEHASTHVRAVPVRRIAAVISYILTGPGWTCPDEWRTEKVERAPS